MREQLAQRPMLALLFGMICGSGLAFGNWPWIAFPFLCLLVWRWKFLGFGVAGFLIGFLLMPAVPELERERRGVSGNLLVSTVPEYGQEARLAWGEYEGKRYRLILPDLGGIHRGDRGSFSGEIRALSEVAGYSRGSVGVIKVERFELEDEGFFLWRWGDQIAASFRESSTEGLSARSAAIVRGVCFNQTDGLDQDDWAAYRRFGVIHLLSASGFHVVVVAGMLLGLFSLFPMPRLVQIGLVLGVLCLFAAAAGFRPPILRAVLMAGIALPAYALRREADSVSAVSLAGVVNLILDPTVMVDLGFQLSMLTTFGLVWVITPQRWDGWNWGARLVAPTIIATCASYPLLGSVFGVVSWVGIIGNIVAAPLVGLLVVFSLLAWAVESLVPPVGSTLWMGIDGLASVVNRIVEIGGSTPGPEFVLPAYSVAGVVGLYGLILAIGGWKK